MIFSRDISISLGSDFVCFMSPDSDDVIEVPAYVAVTVSNDKPEVVAVGAEAWEMRGVEPTNIRVVPVLERGRAADLDIFQSFLRYCLQKEFGGFRLLPPRVILAGCFETEVDRRSCRDGAIQSGVREVRLLEGGVAAAIGLGLSIEEPKFQAVLVLERDWSIYSVISLSGVVVQERLSLGVDQLIEDLQVYLKASEQFCPDRAELLAQVRASGFSAVKDLLGWDQWIEDVSTGRPVTRSLDSEMMTRGISPSFLRAVHRMNTSHTSLEGSVARNVSQTDLYLTGEFGDIPGLDRLLARFLGRNVVVRGDGRRTMVKGTAVVAKNLPWLKKGAK